MYLYNYHSRNPNNKTSCSKHSFCLSLYYLLYSTWDIIQSSYLPMYISLYLFIYPSIYLPICMCYCIILSIYLSKIVYTISIQLSQYVPYFRLYSAKLVIIKQVFNRLFFILILMMK